MVGCKGYETSLQPTVFALFHQWQNISLLPRSSFSYGFAFLVLFKEGNYMLGMLSYRFKTKEKPLKKQLKNTGFLPVMPLAVITTENKGVLNFAPHGQIATVTTDPSVFSIAVRSDHLTAKNLEETGQFSVNIPTTLQLQKLKKAGESSGTKQNKSRLFDVFYKEKGIPYIVDCTFHFGCKVIGKKILFDTTVYFGEVIEAFADDTLVTVEGGIVGVPQIKQLLCSIDGKFWGVGPEITC